MEVELVHQHPDAVGDGLAADPSLAVTARALVAQPQRQGDVLGGGEVGEEVEELEDEADAVAPER